MNPKKYSQKREDFSSKSQKIKKYHDIVLLFLTVHSSPFYTLQCKYSMCCCCTVFGWKIFIIEGIKIGPLCQNYTFFNAFPSLLSTFDYWITFKNVNFDGCTKSMSKIAYASLMELDRNINKPYSEKKTLMQPLQAV